MAEVEKLTGSESPLEIGQKINEIIENGGGSGGLEIGDIGIAPLGIDETQGKRRYLNGQLITQDQYVQFTNKVKSAIELYPSLACTESEWQTTATMTVGGQVGKFVVDDEAGTIRLPKIIMPIQGLTDLSKLAEIVEAGLPSIEHTHSLTLPRVRGDGANADHGVAWGGDDIKRDTKTGKTTSNSKVSDIYGNSNTVQQEQIQYPYFIQVATGAETEDNIINEIELNNPFSLLDYKYSEYELNNLSWLRSEGQYNSKAVYPAVYDLLLKIYNGIETKAGVSVKLTSETFTDYDFVLDTAGETFRLPLKSKFSLVRENSSVVGNGMALGLTDGTSNASVYIRNMANLGGSGAMQLSKDAYGTTAGTVVAEDTSWGTNAKTTIGVTTDPTKSGIELHNDISDLYLYFYVGETIQNANLINAGRIEEKLVGKLDRSDVKTYIIETYVNGTSWYRVWSDGWIEQGGVTTSGKTGTITLLKTFSNTNYMCNLQELALASAYWNGVNITKTTTTITWDISSQNENSYMWEAKGY